MAKEIVKLQKKAGFFCQAKNGSQGGGNLMYTWQLVDPDYRLWSFWWTVMIILTHV